MPRLVRRKPFLERVQDYLNPGDFLLWLSEEVETWDWDSKRYATPLAFGLHVALLIARANSGRSGKRGGDDVFGDDYSGTGWSSYLVRKIDPCLMDGLLTIYRPLSLSIYWHTFLLQTLHTRLLGKDTIGSSKPLLKLPKAPPRHIGHESFLRFPLHHSDSFRTF